MILELNHGLGNQLSLYFAGLAYCLKFNRKLIATLCGNHVANHYSYRDIKDLSLPGEFCERTSGRYGFPSRLAQFMAHRFPFSFRFTGRYYSSLPGFDQDLLSTDGIYRLHGFFHSYCYFDICKELLPDLNLPEILKLSVYASEIAKQLKKPSSVAIHIRRGDYSAHTDSFGLLGVSYYKDALARLELDGSSHEFFIFSDDHESALAIVRKLGISNAIFPDSDGFLKASEVIHLLALSSNLIIANSSMSYWAAVMASSETNVVAPRPFYRNHEISETYFYRKNWNTIDSKFGEP